MPSDGHTSAETALPTGPDARSPTDIARLAAALLERAATSDDPAVLIQAAQALLVTVATDDTQGDHCNAQPGTAATG